MYTVTKYPHGTFSWADTSSTDSAAAKRFYMDLFGWTNFDIPVGEGMTYTMFQHQGQNVAALSEATPEALEQNIPSHWSCYVSVDDVDALLAGRDGQWWPDHLRPHGCLSTAGAWPS